MKKYALACLPFVIALGLAALWLAARLPDPVFYVRADLVSVIVGIGLAASLGWVTGVLLSASARRRTAAALAEAAEAQEEQHRRFLRRLDHELKNPLTAIRAGLANLGDGQPDGHRLPAGDVPQDAAGPAGGAENAPAGQGGGMAVSLSGEAGGRALASVRGQVDRLARLGADLRKLADLETQPVEHALVQTGELLAEVIDLARERPGAETRRLRLTLPSAPWPLPAVPGDRDLLFLALHNLLDNAVKFTRPGDTIEVRAFEDGAWVAVEVADTGPGIPEDELPHLGEELYRGAAARSIEGSGLGLALVRAIVACHGGSFTARSRQGQGTLVTLRLPAAREQ